MEPQKELRLGRLLKDEREKKGLSLDQVAQITRLRKHYIEALEDENWEQLPSPVYVKGFIRSYAKSVGFAAKEAVILYESIAPVEEVIPKPLTGIKQSNRKIFFLLIPFFTVMTLGIYLWVENKGLFTDDKKEQPSAMQEEIIKEPEVSLEQDLILVDQNIDIGLKDKVESEPLFSEMDISNLPQKVGMEYSTDEPGDFVIEAGTEEQVDSFIGPAIGQQVDSVSDGILLTGIVNMRTYIKIYVDDNLPKEYIFRPGSRPQWIAKEGFDILVGNAAGIEFDFNGKRIKDLGGLGKVIRIRFPEEFESKIYEN